MDDSSRNIDPHWADLFPELRREVQEEEETCKQLCLLVGRLMSSGPRKRAFRQRELKLYSMFTGVGLLTVGLTFISVIFSGIGAVGSIDDPGLSQFPKLDPQHLLSGKIPTVINAEQKVHKLLQADRWKKHRDVLVHLAKPYSLVIPGGNMRARPIFDAVRDRKLSVRMPLDIDGRDAKRFLDAIQVKRTLAAHRLNRLRGVPDTGLEIQSRADLVTYEYAPRPYPGTNLDDLSSLESLTPLPGPEVAELRIGRRREDGFPDEQVDIRVGGRSASPIILNVPVGVGAMRVIQVNTTGPVNITVSPVE